MDSVRRAPLAAFGCRPRGFLLRQRLSCRPMQERPRSGRAGSLMTGPKKLKKRIQELDQERTALLKAHQILMDIFWIKRTKDARRRASTALDEAAKREKRIAQLQDELKALEKGQRHSRN